MTQHEANMKAVYIEAFGGPEQLRLGQFPIPIPNPGEVQIQIAYTAVNPVDWKIRSGLLAKRIPHQFPLILGWDAAGVVSALGEGVKKFKIGDRVFAYCRKPTVQFGTYAEYICLNAEDVALMPTNLSFSQAAAIPLAGLTAWQSLIDTAKIKEGESVFIQAGAGGVGSLGIQFAKYKGAFVLTTASKNNHAYVKRLGADIIIDYHTQSVAEAVKQAVPEGLDVVFDTIGGPALQESFSLLKPNGRLVSIVEPPGQELAEQFQVQAFYVFVTPNGQELLDIAELIQEEKIVPIQIYEMPLEKAAEAQEQNRHRHTGGKIVLHVQDL